MKRSESTLLNEKHGRFSIRKFSTGTFSVAIGFLMLIGTQQVQAAEITSIEAKAENTIIEAEILTSEPVAGQISVEQVAVEPSQVTESTSSNVEAPIPVDISSEKETSTDEIIEAPESKENSTPTDIEVETLEDLNKQVEKTETPLQQLIYR